MSAACFFRFLNDDHQPTGWVGFAMADDQEGLMWVIDEFGDPYSVEVMTADRFAYCVQVSEDDEEMTTEGHQTNEQFPPTRGRWREPIWVKRAVEERGKKKRDFSLPEGAVF